MTVKKLELDFEENNNYTVLGIITALPEYILAHHINNTMRVDFIRYDDVEISSGKENHYFPWFYSYFDEFKTKLYLVNNSIPEKRLLPKLKNVDYLLIFESDFEQELEKIFIKKIREIPGVTGIYKLDAKYTDSIEFLIEKFEIIESGSVKNKPEN